MPATDYFVGQAHGRHLTDAYQPRVQMARLVRNAGRLPAPRRRRGDQCITGIDNPQPGYRALPDFGAVSSYGRRTKRHVRGSAFIKAQLTGGTPASAVFSSWKHIRHSDCPAPLLHLLTVRLVQACVYSSALPAFIACHTAHDSAHPNPACCHSHRASRRMRFDADTLRRGRI